MTKKLPITVKLANILAYAQIDAARHARAVIKGEHPDAHVPWSEVTGRTRAALQFAAASMAAERAKTISEAPRSFGVVVVSGRLEDTKDGRLAWEANAARLKAERETKAIEAVAAPAKEEEK